tara:strand:+ start:1404 stop:3365 length:1962 start_codon:yes stop_codon:yes gene_type:complete
MAINFVYPILSTVTGAELLVVADPADSNKTRNITVAQIVALSGAGCCSLQATTTAGDSTNDDIRMLAGDLTVNPGTANLAVVDIDSGAIDGTSVGLTVPSTGDFTTLTASGLAALADDLTVAGDAAVVGDFGVTGDTSLSGTLTVGLTSTLTGSVAIGTNLTVAGTLGVTGLSTLPTVDINGGAIDGTTIGAIAPAAIDGTTITSTSTITSGADFIAADTFSYTVNPSDPTTGLGAVVGLECIPTPTCNVTFYGASGFAPTETHINAADGVTITVGAADRLSIASTGTGLAEYVGATFSNAAIDAAPPNVLVTKGWIENPSAPVVIDTGGDNYVIEGLGTSGVAINEAAPAAGCTLDVGGTQGGLAPPSLTVAQAGVVDPVIVKPGTKYYNNEQRMMKISSVAGASVKAFQPDVVEILNAGSTPLSAAVGTTHVQADTSAGAVTLNLPRITVNVPIGAEITVKDISDNAFTNNITIVQNVADTIDTSATNPVISRNSGSITLRSNGTSNWEILSQDISGATTEIKTVSGTLTSAQILTMFATPIDVLPATAGVIWMPLHVNIILAAAGGIAYATNTTLQLMGNSLGGSSTNELNCLAHVGSSPSINLPETAPGAAPFAAQYQANTALSWKVKTGNPTAGDYDIFYDIIYATIT